MFESVVDCFHQLMGRIKLVLCADDDLSKLIDERLRLSAPHCQSKSGRLILYVPLDLVELSVHIKNGAANNLLGEFSFKIFAARVSVAAGFYSTSVLVQRIEAAGSIGLNDASEIAKECQIFLKGKVWREIEHVYWVRRVADVCRDFSFANIVLVAAVLNLDGRVVGFDDCGVQQFLLHQVIQQRQCVGGYLHPVALSRAWNINVVASEDFLLPIVGKSIVEFADDDFAKKSRAGVAARNGCARFFSRSYVLLTARTGTGFLQVVEDLEAGADHFELMGEKVADEDSFDGAVGTDGCISSDEVLDRLVREIFSILENVFDADGRVLFGTIGYAGFRLRLQQCRARIMFFRLVPVVSLVALFRLGDQHIDLGLQVFEKLTHLLVAVERLLELPLQVFNELGQAFDFGLCFGVVFLQLSKIFIHRAPLVVSSK